MRSPTAILGRLLCGLLLLLLPPAAVHAQASALDPARAPMLPPLAAPAPGGEPGSELTVYLMTMGPGEAIWEKFGHNAIWIRNAATGEDVAYNWGLFDLAEEGFIVRFMQGRMRYWMAGAPAQWTVDGYALMNRSVWAQELDLTPAERRELYEFVKWNEREENRFYLYDYYRDNCSTRVRDALDRVLGGQIRAATDSVPTTHTWRSHTRRLTQGLLPIYTGIDVMLGPAVDRPISAWEDMFLPMQLREHVRGVQVRRADGSVRPLVRGEAQLFAATRDAEPAAPTNFLPAFAAIGVALAALLTMLAWRGAAGGSRGARTGFAVVGALWSLVAGIVGTVTALTWMLTDHSVVYGNENLLQFAPLSLLLVVLLPRSMRGRGGTLTWRLALLVAGLSVLGFALQLLPGLDQVNGLAIALAMPVHVAVAVGLWTMRERRTANREQPA